MTSKTNMYSNTQKRTKQKLSLKIEWQLDGKYSVLID